jgi:hypothetical protein
MEIRIVAISGAVVAALTLLLTVQVFVMRLLLIARTRRAERFLSVWQPLLFQAVEGLPSELPRLAAADVFTFLGLWNHLQESVVDDAKDRLNEVARRAGIPEIARGMVRRGTLRGRLLAIVTLGQLQDRSVWDLLCTCAASPQVVLSLTAARALVQIDRQAAIHHLMPSIATRLDWPLARVASLLRDAGPDVVSNALAAAAVAAPPREAARLIRYLDVVHCEAAIPAVRQIMCRSDDKDVIAACLRVVQDPEDLDVIRRFLGDPRWEIRVQAATALGRMGTAGDEHRLAQCLADPEWWVRYRAAQALCTLLVDSPERLDRLQHEHENAFARDVLAQARAESDLR